MAFLATSLYFYPDLSIHPLWPTTVWLLGEFLLSSYVLLLIIRYAAFFTTGVLTAGLIFVRHLNEQRRAVERLLQGLLIKKTERYLSPNCRLTVERHLAEHNTVSYLILAGSERMFGNATAAFVYTNASPVFCSRIFLKYFTYLQIPINIFLLARIVFQRHQMWFTLATYWTVVAIQLLELVVVFSPVSHAHIVLHKPAKMIPHLQAAMMMVDGCGGLTKKKHTKAASMSAWTRLKLKHDDLYGRLLSGPKLTATCGVQFEITYFGFYEVLSYQKNITTLIFNFKIFLLLYFLATCNLHCLSFAGIQSDDWLKSIQARCKRIKIPVIRSLNK